MKIICLSCGNKVELGDDYDDYAGQVMCVACKALLAIKTKTGSIRGVAVVREAANAPEGDRSMEIICLSCGSKVELGDDYDDYTGQVMCAACEALLDIKTETGSIRAVTVVRETTNAPSSR